MRPYDFFASTLHFMTPSLKPVSDIAHISIDDTYSPRARPMLNDKYHHHGSIELADSYYPKHVLYCYGYITGYCIDDLEGIVPTACIAFVVECSFRFLLVHDLLHGDQVRGDIPWGHGGCKAW
ncbi:hypothetical protein ZWY2020_040903 [Hordeum vulgare]|nr:hypothetical protein ZWY2020_040903 [Hordeum vulgare]